MVVSLPSKDVEPRVSSPPAHLSTHGMVASCEALCSRDLDVSYTGACCWVAMESVKPGMSLRSSSGMEAVAPSQGGGKRSHRATPEPWLQVLTHALLSYWTELMKCKFKDQIAKGCRLAITAHVQGPKTQRNFGFCLFVFIYLLISPRNTHGKAHM